MLIAQLDSVIYISNANPNLTERDLIDIIEVSQRNNSFYGITGILCFNGTNFIQFLEGDRDMINARINLIEADSRHHGMVIIKRHISQDREFPGWCMASSVIDTKAYKTDQKLVDLLEIDTVTQETREIFNNFRSLGRGV